MRLFVFLIAAAAAAQTTFEVASVKSVDMRAPGFRYTPLTGGPGTSTPAKFSGNTTVKALLMKAYGVKGYQVSGQEWMDTEVYEIAATIAPGATKEQFAAMLQNLMAERFRLTFHRETKEVPVYALIVGKNGPKLEECDPEAVAADEKAAAEAAKAPRPRVTMGPDGFPQIPPGTKMPGSFTLSLTNGEFRRIKMFQKHGSMDGLADAISGYVDRPVQDFTELKGRYDFTLAFETDPRNSAAPNDLAPAAADRGPTVFAALQEQLGLRLESRKGSIEKLIIDRIEKVPTEN